MKQSLAGLVFLGCLASAAVAHATTYYVANEGNDANNGTSPDTPWATLHQVNSVVFQPGDKILLRRGSVWQGILVPCAAARCSGAPGAPIKIDSYDVGTVKHTPPRIDGAGSGRATISLVNQSYWEIRNLEITNTGPPGFHYVGVEAICDSTDPAQRVCHHLNVGHNIVRDVNGMVDSYYDGGIVIMQNMTNTRVENGALVSNSNHWDDVVIEQNTIRRVSRVGIFVSEYFGQPADLLCPSGAQSCKLQRPLATNVKIVANGMTTIAGDGILVLLTNGALIDHNGLGNWGTLNGPAVAGIWSAATTNTTIQHNEVYGGTCCADRMAFDIDFGNISDHVQYNYSHNNYGGMIGFIDTYDPGTAFDAYIDDPIVRFNISVNDGVQTVINTCLGRFSVGLNPLDFTNNSIYQSATNFYTHQPNQIEIFGDCGARNFTSGNCDAPSYNGPHIDGSAWIYNNIFYVEGHATYAKLTGAGLGDNTFYSPNTPPTCEPGDGGKSTANPLFASSPAAPAVPLDFQLKTGSPALATGMFTTTVGPVDYFGNVVSTTSPPSRGAYAGPGVP